MSGLLADDAVLTHFFTIHFFLPFIIAGNSLLDLVFIHVNPTPFELFWKNFKNWQKQGCCPYYFCSSTPGILFINLATLSFALPSCNLPGEP